MKARSLFIAAMPGLFVLADQFVDRTFGRESSFFGNGCVAHVSMAHPVAPLLQKRIEAAAVAEGIACRREGTYVCMEGPQFSTLAESNLYRSWGCDVIGMTNMPEAKLAREAELCYASVAMVTGVVMVTPLVVTLLAVAELLVFAGVVAPGWSLAHFTANGWAGESRFSMGTWAGIFASIPFAIWFFLAIEGAAMAAEEAKDPQRDLSRGFLSGVGGTTGGVGAGTTWVGSALGLPVDGRRGPAGRGTSSVTACAATSGASVGLAPAHRPKAPSTLLPNPRCRCGIWQRSTYWSVRPAARSPIWTAAQVRTAAARSPPN